MKYISLLIISLFCTPSCSTTYSGHEPHFQHEAKAPDLNVNVSYGASKSNGVATGYRILGLFYFGPSDFSYSSNQSERDSLESAAIANALAQKDGDILGAPMFKRHITNYLLWTVEEVTVSGFSGKVTGSSAGNYGNRGIR
jgi:hypothetical protein